MYNAFSILLIYISWPSLVQVVCWKIYANLLETVALTSLVSMMWRPKSERLVPRLQNWTMPAVVRENPQLPKH